MIYRKADLKWKKWRGGHMRSSVYGDNYDENMQGDAFVTGMIEWCNEQGTGNREQGGTEGRESTTNDDHLPVQ